MTETEQNFNQAGRSSDAKEQPAPYILVRKTEEGTKEIVIENLTVKTPGERGAVLVHELNMTLKLGEKLILTGKNGTGKTTVARALLNQWDHGTGIINIPSGLKTMAMSQKVNLSNTTLRGILNMAPEKEGDFSDRELREVLQAVGHDALIQHIPGQQVEILMDDLLEQISVMLKAYTETGLYEEQLQDLQSEISGLVKDLVHRQFDYVQYVPEEQRAYLKEKMSVLFSDRLKENAPTKAETEKLVKVTLDKIDIELSQILYHAMKKGLPYIVDRARQGKLIGYTPDKAASFAAALYGKMSKRLTLYRENKDTEDPDREIKINALQAEHVIWRLITDIKNELIKPVKRGVLRSLYNAVVSMPLRVLTPASQSGILSKEMAQSVNLFMHRQTVTGDVFARQLSGGEQQRLMFARILLHKPDLLILDEITASLDKETGMKLYEQMIEGLPKGTTVISIAHNEHIMKFHTLHGNLEDQTIKLKKIAPTGGAKKAVNDPPAPKI